MRPLLLVALALLAPGSDPPYGGTVWVDPDILTAADPSAYVGYTPTGRGTRTVYDRRPAAWVQINAHLFEVSFDDGTTAEFIVNPEFNAEAAADASEYYGRAIGRLATHLRKDMREVWIHSGENPFGGGNNSILIHDTYGKQVAQQGFLEEVLIHEAAHTSLDAEHAEAAGWLAAQAADPEFISTYARDNPVREDVAETILLWYAVRHRPGRISESDRERIHAAIPNRMAYLDEVGVSWDWHPMFTAGTRIEPVTPPWSFDLGTPHPNPFFSTVSFTLSLREQARIRAAAFDLLGRRVDVLWDGPAPVGDLELVWTPAADVGSGVYIIRVESGDGVWPVAVSLVR